MKETKKRILDAASEIFLEQGPKGLSVRAIAKQAGLSTIGIYSHFNGKQGILDTLYIEGFTLFHEALDVLDDIEDPKEALLTASHNYLQVVEQYEAHYRLIFGESNSAYTPSEEAVEVGAKAFNMLTKLTSLLLPADASLEDKQAVAMEIWALTHGYISLNHHLIAQILDMSDWKQRLLNALELHAEGLLAKHRAP